MKITDKAQSLMGYASTDQGACPRYYASNIILYIYSATSYVALSNARSCIAGYHFCKAMKEIPTQQRTLSVKF